MQLTRGLAALSLLACVCVVTRAQTPAAPLPLPRLQFFDIQGRPLSGGKIYTYAAGTSAPLATYTAADGAIANTNPVVLDAGGMASIWVKNGLYKIIVTDSNGVQQWTADNVSNTAQVIAAGGGFATLDNTGRLPASQLTLYAPTGTGATSRAVGVKLGEAVSMEDFAGADCGAQLNAAYAALPAAGGTIGIHSSCSFSTPVNIGTANKIAVLQGSGSATVLTYTGSSGTAFTLNNGRQFDFSTSIRDLTISGPGLASSTTGVQIGGSLGCVGCSIEHTLIQGFGTGLKYQDNTWITSVSHSMIRGNGVNVLIPSGMTEAGENVQFNHVTFADAPAPHANSVWVQGGGQEVDFTDCSFDQAQLRIGNGSTSAAQVNIKGAHFENPNFATGSTYDYLTVDNHNGNLVRISDSYFLQDNSSAAPSRFAYFGGGKIVLSGIGMYTPGSAPMVNFATVANAVNIDFFSFSDLSGNVTGPLLGGTTTGYVSMFTGANPGSNVPRNNILKQGDTVGGASLDVSGIIRSSFQVVALAATGTAPFVVNSTTPVNNLMANSVIYTAGGTQNTNSTHFVQGTATLSAGAATVTLSGSAAFTNSSTFSCWGVDTSTTAAVRTAPASGTSFTISGTGADNVSYTCLGY